MVLTASVFPTGTTAPMLTGATIDRADAIRTDPVALAGMMNWRARLLRMNGTDPAFDADGNLQWGSIADASEDSDLAFLGLDDGKPCFVEIIAAPLPRGLAPPMLWQALSSLPAPQLALYGAARALVDWHARNRFCANCGTPTHLAKGGWGRACGACKAEHFARVDPVTIMLAEYQGKVLLGRQPQFPAKRFSALAGFVEPGEAIEEAVARELYEEAGIRVANVRYVSSQPWPFPSSLMIGCTSDALDDVLTIDTKELDEAAWFTLADVRAAMADDPAAPFIAPPPMAIARNLLQYWLDKQE